ncbi:MAG: hypothetical protein FJZ64_04485 [Chlamydiae bacterium]|nr:hypothetical protein [Chlamydiota bacterium]
MLSYAILALMAVAGSTEPAKVDPETEETLENEIVFEEWEENSDAEEIVLDDSLMSAEDLEETESPE